MCSVCRMVDWSFLLEADVVNYLIFLGSKLIWEIINGASYMEVHSCELEFWPLFSKDMGKMSTFVQQRRVEKKEGDSQQVEKG